MEYYLQVPENEPNYAENAHSKNKKWMYICIYIGAFKNKNNTVDHHFYIFMHSLTCMEKLPYNLSANVIITNNNFYEKRTTITYNI